MKALEGAAPVADPADHFGGPARLLAGRAAGLDISPTSTRPNLYDRPGTPYLDARGAPTFPKPPTLRSPRLRRRRDPRAAAIPGLATRSSVHGHDWQAGLRPITCAATGPAASSRSTNIAFQGVRARFSFDVGSGSTGADFYDGGYDLGPGSSTLKAGLALRHPADHGQPDPIARLSLADSALGLDGLLRARERDLFAASQRHRTPTPGTPHRTPPFATFRTPKGKGAREKGPGARSSICRGDGPPLRSSVLAASRTRRASDCAARRPAGPDSTGAASFVSSRHRRPRHRGELRAAARPPAGRGSDRL